MKPRSKTDRERLQYEAQRAVNMLAALELEANAHQQHQRAQAIGRIKADLASALAGKRTGFDYFGGRGEFIRQEKVA